MASRGAGAARLAEGTPAFRFRCDNTSGMCKPPCTGATRCSAVQGGVWELRAPRSPLWYPVASSNLILSRAHLQIPVSLKPREKGERCH